MKFLLWLWLAQEPRDPAIEFDVGDLGDGEVARAARGGDPLGRFGLLKNGLGVGLVPGTVPGSRRGACVINPP